MSNIPRNWPPAATDAYPKSSCPGCTYVSGCCCGKFRYSCFGAARAATTDLALIGASPGRLSGSGKSHTVTVRKTATRGIERKATWAASKPAKLTPNRLSVEGQSPRPGSLSVGSMELEGSVLRARQLNRHLCPACPSKVKVLSQVAAGRQPIYCCAPRRTKTKTITVTKSPLATLKGRLFYDNNKDGLFTPGIDVLIA